MNARATNEQNANFYQFFDGTVSESFGLTMAACQATVTVARDESGLLCWSWRSTARDLTTALFKQKTTLAERELKFYPEQNGRGGYLRYTETRAADGEIRAVDAGLQGAHAFFKHATNLTHACHILPSWMRGSGQLRELTPAQQVAWIELCNVLRLEANRPAERAFASSGAAPAND